MSQTVIQTKSSERMTVKPGPNCLKCSHLITFLLFFQFGFSQYNFTAVEEILQKNKKALGGEMAIVISKDGKPIYQKTLGEFTAKTAAPIANCSKWLAAALVMIYVDEGKISLDDPISKYIPASEKYMKGYITIRNCLSHTTGLEAEGTGIKGILQKSKFETLDAEINNLLAKREIVNNPGKEFFYSNVGLDLAGRVIEVVSKKTFDRVVQEKLLRPLNMRATTFYSESGGVNPSMGAVSTAMDLNNFLTMLLNKGMFNGKRILSEKSVVEMEKQQFPEAVTKYAPPIVVGLTYGLGEWVFEKDQQGNATVVCTPTLSGSWPWIDKCRGYACVLLVKDILSEQHKEIFVSLKEAIDSQLQQNCPGQ